MHWFIMARRIGAQGLGFPVGRYTGKAENWRGCDDLTRRGYEPVFPPLIPTRLSGDFYTGRDSRIGPPEPHGIRLFDAPAEDPKPYHRYMASQYR